MARKRIAVLALQGAFAEHRAMLSRLGVDTFEVRQLSDWHQPKDGLVIPGGESTTQRKLLADLGLLLPLRDEIAGGLPVFGTCAGLILLAGEIVGEGKGALGTMDIRVVRNAYGRQLGSFHHQGAVGGIGNDIPMTFIRAPYIERCGPLATSLSVVDGRCVAALQGRQLVTAFHPELDDDLRVHRFFVESVVR